MFYVNIVVIYFLYLIVCISESLPFALNFKTDLPVGDGAWHHLCSLCIPLYILD